MSDRILLGRKGGIWFHPEFDSTYGYRIPLDPVLGEPEDLLLWIQQTVVTDAVSDVAIAISQEHIEGTGKLSADRGYAQTYSFIRTVRVDFNMHVMKWDESNVIYQRHAELTDSAHPPFPKWMQERYRNFESVGLVFANQNTPYDAADPVTHVDRTNCFFGNFSINMEQTQLLRDIQRWHCTAIADTFVGYERLERDDSPVP